MKCQAEFEYLLQIVNDHITTLPPSSKVVVSREAQLCANKVAAVLQEQPAAVAAPAAPTTPAPPAPIAPPAEPSVPAPTVAAAPVVVAPAE